MGCALPTVDRIRIVRAKVAVGFDDRPRLQKTCHSRGVTGQAFADCTWPWKSPKSFWPLAALALLEFWQPFAESSDVRVARHSDTVGVNLCDKTGLRYRGTDKGTVRVSLTGVNWRQHRGLHQKKSSVAKDGFRVHQFFVQVSGPVSHRTPDTFGVELPCRSSFCKRCRTGRTWASGVGRRSDPIPVSCA